MIYLIAGSTHSGKTLFAQRLLERLHIPYLSLDHLKMGLIRSAVTKLRVDQDEELTALLWPIVVGIIQTALENEQELIIEGCYIPADWAKSFTDLQRRQIRCLFLVFSQRYLQCHFKEIVAYGSVIEKRKEDALEQRELADDQQRLLAALQSEGCSYLLIDKRYPSGEEMIAALLQA